MTVHHMYFDRLLRPCERAALLLAAYTSRLSPGSRRPAGKVLRITGARDWCVVLTLGITALYRHGCRLHVRLGIM